MTNKSGFYSVFLLAPEYYPIIPDTE